MRKASSRQLQHNQDAQSAVMGDLCNIYRLTFVTGTYSDDESYTTSGTFNVPCGIHFENGQVRQVQGNEQVLLLDYDVMLRLSASQTVLMSDDIQLVEKGEFVISGTFQPSSQPTVNSSVQHVPLKRKVV